MFPYITEDTSIKVGDYAIVSSKEVKLLGIVIDNKLTFVSHIKDLCTKALRKAKSLMRIRSYLSQDQTNHIFNAFILPSFQYCPLVWMFCSKSAQTMIEKTHHKLLRIQFNSFSHSYLKLLEMDDTMDIHTKNLRLLVVETFFSSIHP